MYIAAPIIFLLLLFGIPYVWTHIQREGWFVSSEFAPYHRKIVEILQPYRAAEFAKNILGNHASQCKCYDKRLKEGSASELEKEIVNFLLKNRSKSNIVEIYSMMKIIYYIRYGCNYANGEFETMRLLIENLSNKLKKRDDIPQELFRYFCMNQEFEIMWAAE